MYFSKNLIILVCLLISLSACDNGKKRVKTTAQADNTTQLDSIIAPTDTITLGEKLFFDTKLSLDNSIACASCHIPEYGFADTSALSIGVHGALGKRNTPTVMNMLSRSEFFYDGRAITLEDQVHFPIEDAAEMNIKMDEVVERLKKDKYYPEWFMSILKQEITRESIAFAIAEYERSLETSDTPFDDYMGGDSTYMSESAIRGHELFVSERSKCFECHFSPDFTGDEFRNIGLYDGVKYTDVGRFAVTKDSADIGKFKTPQLRNVAITPPYMHDGSFKTLEEVIDYYSDPYVFVEKPINMDSLMLEPINFTAQEKEDLINFLHSLTDRRFTKKSGGK